MIVVNRDRKTCNIIDIAVPGDAGIVEKEKEKVRKSTKTYVERWHDSGMSKQMLFLLWLVH